MVSEAASEPSDFKAQRKEALKRYRERQREKALARSLEDRMESVQRALSQAELSARAASRVAGDQREAAALRGKAKAYWEAKMMIGAMVAHGYLPRHWQNRPRSPK